MSKELKRLAIYMFFDEAGIVDDYVPHKLRELRKHVDTIFVVSNSRLTVESRAKLEQVVDSVYVRQNVGYDVWAYKEALEKFGWDKVIEFDELVLLNYTFFGPLYPFSELFSAVDRVKCDFWGITAHQAVRDASGREVQAEHIQSHWLAVRGRMLKSREFRDYWDEMRVIKSYDDSIAHHEVRFTQHFKNAGFVPYVYMDPTEFPSKHALFDNVDLMVERRCPIIKRRTFFHDPAYLERFGVRLPEAVATIKRAGFYDTSLLWQNLTRTARLRTLMANIEALRVLPDTHVLARNARLKKYRVAVLAHVFYPEMTEEILGYVAHIPVETDVFITTNTKANAAKIKTELARVGKSVKEIRVAPEDRGRDMGPLVILCRDVVLDGDYDLICRVHSKKSPQDGYNLGTLFKRHMFENLLASTEYVTNVLLAFDEEPRLGMAFPPTVHIGYPTLGHAWFNNQEGASALAQKLGLSVVFDQDTPVAPFGGMFWFRPEALRKLFAYNWKWSHFNKEPDNRDGSMTHVLERIIAYVAQDAGFLSNWVMSPRMAAINYVKLEDKYQRVASEMPYGLPSEQTAWLRSLREQKIGWFWNRFHTTADYLLKEYPTVARPIRPLWKRSRTAVRSLREKLKK